MKGSYHIQYSTAWFDKIQCSSQFLLEQIALLLYCEMTSSESFFLRYISLNSNFGMRHHWPMKHCCCPLESCSKINFEVRIVLKQAQTFRILKFSNYSRQNSANPYLNSSLNLKKNDYCKIWYMFKLKVLKLDEPRIWKKKMSSFKH